MRIWLDVDGSLRGLEDGMALEFMILLLQRLYLDTLTKWLFKLVSLEWRGAFLLGVWEGYKILLFAIY